MTETIDLDDDDDLSLPWNQQHKHTAKPTNTTSSSTTKNNNNNNNNSSSRKPISPTIESDDEDKYFKKKQIEPTTTKKRKEKEKEVIEDIEEPDDQIKDQKSFVKKKSKKNNNNDSSSVVEDVEMYGGSFSSINQTINDDTDDDETILTEFVRDDDRKPKRKATTDAKKKQAKGGKAMADAVTAKPRGRKKKVSSSDEDYIGEDDNDASMVADEEDEHFVQIRSSQSIENSKKGSKKSSSTTSSRVPKKKSKKDSLAEMTMMFDGRLYQLESTKDLLQIINEEVKDDTFAIESELLQVEYSIIWKRDQIPDNKYMVIMYPTSVFSELITTERFVKEVKKICSRYKDTQIIVIFDGMQEFTKKLSESIRNEKSDLPINQQQKHFSKQTIESYFIQLRIENSVMIYTPSCRKDVATLLIKLTETIGYLPYRTDTNALFEGFCAESIKKSSKRPEEVWLRQLSMINGVSNNIARSITEKYPSLMSLVTAYESTPSNRREGMLADIKIDSTTSKNQKRLGPALSLKIFTIFNTSDPNKLVQ